MSFGLVEMSKKALLELLIYRLARHLLQRFLELLLGIVDVLQLVHEQVVQVFDVPGEESHDAIPLLCGTQPRFSFASSAPICSMADTIANRRARRLFRVPARDAIRKKEPVEQRNKRGSHTETVIRDPNAAPRNMYEL